MSGRVDERSAVRPLGAVAGVLAVAAAFSLAAFPAPVAGVLAVALVLVLAVAWARLVRDLHVVRTADGIALIYDIAGPEGERVRVLRQGGVYQSATWRGARRFEPVFAYHRAFDCAFDLVDGARPVAAADRAVPGGCAIAALAFGGGGYAWPKHALTEHPDLALDVVEIDPAVTAAARRWFFLDELERIAGGRLRLITADARAYLESADAPVYDIIVSDVFRGAEPVRALATVGAARAVARHLAPDGVYLMNVVSTREGSDLGFLRDEVATLLEVFACVRVVPAEDDDFGGEDNYLVVASDRAFDLAGAVPFDDGFLGSPIAD